MPNVWKCLLSADGVLRGYAEIDDTSVLPGDLVFAYKPDLEPGQYIWNGESFLPVRKTSPFVPDGPDPWDAVVAAMNRQRQNINTSQAMLALLKQIPALAAIPAFQALEFNDLPPSCLQFLTYYRDNIIRAPVNPSSGA